MTFRGLIFVPLFALLLIACGGGEETSAAGVASASDLNETLEDATALATEAVSDAAADTDVSAEEAGLALAECMRGSGFDDFPDPVIDENGNVNLRAALTDSGVDAQAEGFREQINTCRDEVGADNLGGGGRAEQQEAVQEQLLAYTQCLRDEGLDVGDLGAAGDRAQQGQGDQADNADGAGNAQGRAQGNGGAGVDRGARIAQALGLDADDPDTAAALTACNDVLEQAFAGAGVGQAPTTDT